MTKEEFMKWVGRSAVAITWTDRGIEGILEGFVFSGFVMSIKGFWILITAGHIIEDLNGRMDAGRKFERASIVDCWGDGAINNMAIPFPGITSLPQGHVYSLEKGLDYAWFILSNYYVELLRANNVIALDEPTWHGLPDAHDGYAVFGFPKDQQHQVFTGNKLTDFRVKATLLPYVLAVEPPEIKRTNPRIYFQPKDPAVKTVDGFSGGPIFGFNYVSGGTRVWLVAIQSHEYKGIAIGCPMEIFGASVNEAIEQAIVKLEVTENAGK